MNKSCLNPLSLVQEPMAFTGGEEFSIKGVSPFFGAIRLARANPRSTIVMEV